MPKAILEFNLPEEDLEHNLAINGHLWRSVVWDVDRALRDREKHTEETHVNIDDLRQVIYDCMSDNNLSFD